MSSNEISYIKNGVIPHTEPGQNIFQTLSDLITYSQGPESSNLKPEQLSLLQVRIIGLQAELLKQVRQQQTEQGGGAIPTQPGEAQPVGTGGLPPSAGVPAGIEAA